MSLNTNIHAPTSPSPPHSTTPLCYGILWLRTIFTPQDDALRLIVCLSSRGTSKNALHFNDDVTGANAATSSSSGSGHHHQHNGADGDTGVLSSHASVLHHPQPGQVHVQPSAAAIPLLPEPCVCDVLMRACSYDMFPTSSLLGSRGGGGGGGDSSSKVSPASVALLVQEPITTTTSDDDGGQTATLWRRASNRETVSQLFSNRMLHTADRIKKQKSSSISVVEIECVLVPIERVAVALQRLGNSVDTGPQFFSGMSAGEGVVANERKTPTTRTSNSRPHTPTTTTAETKEEKEQRARWVSPAAKTPTESASWAQKRLVNSRQLSPSSTMRGSKMADYSHVKPKVVFTPTVVGKTEENNSNSSPQSLQNRSTTGATAGQCCSDISGGARQSIADSAARRLLFSSSSPQTLQKKVDDYRPPMKAVESDAATGGTNANHSMRQEDNSTTASISAAEEDDTVVANGEPAAGSRSHTYQAPSEGGVFRAQQTASPTPSTVTPTKFASIKLSMDSPSPSPKKSTDQPTLNVAGKRGGARESASPAVAADGDGAVTNSVVTEKQSWEERLEMFTAASTVSSSPRKKQLHVDPSPAPSSSRRLEQSLHNQSTKVPKPKSFSPRSPSAARTLTLVDKLSRDSRVQREKQQQHVERQRVSSPPKRLPSPTAARVTAAGGRAVKSTSSPLPRKKEEKEARGQFPSLSDGNRPHHSSAVAGVAAGRTTTERGGTTPVPLRHSSTETSSIIASRPIGSNTKLVVAEDDDEEDEDEEDDEEDGSAELIVVSNSTTRQSSAASSRRWSPAPPSAASSPVLLSPLPNHTTTMPTRTSAAVLLFPPPSDFSTDSMKHISPTRGGGRSAHNNNTNSSQLCIVPSTQFLVLNSVLLSFMTLEDIVSVSSCTRSSLLHYRTSPFTIRSRISSILRLDQERAHLQLVPQPTLVSVLLSTTATTNRDVFRLLSVTCELVRGGDRCATYEDCVATVQRPDFLDTLGRLSCCNVDDVVLWERTTGDVDNWTGTGSRQSPHRHSPRSPSTRVLLIPPILARSSAHVIRRVDPKRLPDLLLPLYSFLAGILLVKEGYTEARWFLERNRHWLTPL